jgi:hypothetical protein
LNAFKNLPGHKKIGPIVNINSSWCGTLTITMERRAQQIAISPSFFSNPGWNFVA